jgi:hypothetical protein
MTKPTIRELLDAAGKSGAEDLQGLMDRALAGTLLAGRVEKVIALHRPDESYTCGHCQTRSRLRCATVRLLEGEP